MTKFEELIELLRRDFEGYDSVLDRIDHHVEQIALKTEENAKNNHGLFNPEIIDQLEGMLDKSNLKDLMETCSSVECTGCVITKIQDTIPKELVPISLVIFGSILKDKKEHNFYKKNANLTFIRLSQN